MVLNPRIGVDGSPAPLRKTLTYLIQNKCVAEKRGRKVLKAYSACVIVDCKQKVVTVLQRMAKLFQDIVEGSTQVPELSSEIQKIL